MLNKDKIKLAIAPIAWTNDDMPDLGAENTFEQCVSEMALAGFTGSEVGCKYPADPAVLKPMLDIRGLQICNQWFSSLVFSEGVEVTLANLRQQLAFLKAMGASVIGASEQGNSIQGKDLAVFTEKAVLTDEQWQLFTDAINQMGQIAKEEGFSFTYHHHMGTCVQTREETRKFLAMTNPETVSLLFDSGHFAFSGEDPVECLKEFAPRVKHVHLKDVRGEVVARAKAEGWSFLKAVREGAFTVPGDGDIDFAPIFKVLEEHNYEGWMVVEAEQDPAKANPFAYAKKARKYIADVAGV